MEIPNQEAVVDAHVSVAEKKDLSWLLTLPLGGCVGAAAGVWAGAELLGATTGVVLGYRFWCRNRFCRILRDNVATIQRTHFAQPGQRVECLCLCDKLFDWRHNGLQV
jgi:hypothetical protein